MNKTIRLTESDLHKIVKESVNKILLETSQGLKCDREKEYSKKVKEDIRNRLSNVIEELESEQQYINIYPQENGEVLVTIENGNEQYAEHWMGRKVWESSCAYELVRALRRLKYTVKKEYGETLYGDFFAKIYCFPK